MNRRAGGAMEAEDRSSVPAPSSAPVPGENHSDSSPAPEAEDQLQSLSPLQCVQQQGKKPQIKCPAAKTNPPKKPQVPPKPVHFKSLGQERDLQRIPPAPRRPLPADPRPSRTLLSAEGETQISPDINSLIEKFESIWHPIPILQRSQSHLPFRMESGLGSSASPNIADCELSFGSGDSSEKNKRDGSQPAVLGIVEPSSTDLGKIRELHIGDSQSFEDCSSAKPNKEAMGRDGVKAPAVEQGGNGKIPNRDSGIDSPSCSVAGETFPTEEGEHKKYPTPGLLIEIEPEIERNVSSPGDTQKEIAQEADSDVDEGSSEEPETTDVPKGEDLDVAKCTDPQKLFNIANELLHTEEAYVKRLHLLDQVFCTKLAEAGIPSEVTTGIFSNISSIYCFHGQFLLPELQTRITQEWSTNPRIGDILQKLAPFLKMYGEYVKNFDRAMDLVNTWTQRSSPFKDVVQSIQKQEVCGNLTLQHHMLEPVQRIPRYEMLLKDYLKKLPGESPDRKDAEKSLELISTAANHSNAAIRKMEKMHKLLEVYERLGGEEDIVNPANELIKEGHIQKLSAKNGTAQDRYLFLFNSMLLYCVPKLRLIGQKFSVREKMDIAGLQVQEIAKPNATHTFTITGKKRSLDLQTRTEEDKKEWIEVILATIEKHKQKSETFRAFNSSFAQEEDVPDSPMASTSSVESMAGTDGCSGFGGLDSRKSSKNRRDKEKQTCKSCSETFNSITKRRHHCKQCGAVICGKCSEFKADNSRQSRVCKECFLMQTTIPNSPVSEAGSEQRKKLEKQNIIAPENSLFCSHLQLMDKGKVCCKLWATIPKTEPLVLYLQGGQDGRSPRTIPLPGYEVTLPGPGEKLEAKYTLKLSQSHQTLYLSFEDEELQRRWMEVLTRAARGETDDPSASVGSAQGP